MYGQIKWSKESSVQVCVRVCVCVCVTQVSQTRCDRDVDRIASLMVRFQVHKVSTVCGPWPLQRKALCCFQYIICQTKMVSKWKLTEFYQVLLVVTTNELTAERQIAQIHIGCQFIAVSCAFTIRKMWMRKGGMEAQVNVTGSPLIWA